MGYSAVIGRKVVPNHRLLLQAMTEPDLYQSVAPLHSGGSLAIAGRVDVTAQAFEFLALMRAAAHFGM